MEPPTDLDVATVEPSAGAPTSSPLANSGRNARLGLVVVAIVPLLENLAAILRIVKYEPQATTSGIGFITRVGITHGQPFIDPNVGYNSQALGRAVALSWLHGHVPWWNLNEGLGMPLAASIQSATFFPLTLLMALSQGTLWFHIALECLIGVATYALLRELRVTPFAAAAGAIAFELNGAIAWITNAPANPVAFLPVCLLGVEYVMGAAGAKRRGGWVLLALGVWLSIVAGFPEVALLNSGLVACWFLVRLAQRPRDAARAILRGAVGVGVGFLLAAPLLNAFVRYLRVGDIGLHKLPIASLSTIPRAGLAQLVSPYVFGGIFDSQDPTIFVVWSRIGGYTGITLLVLAVGSLFGARERVLRLMLAGWAILFLGSAYNVPVLHQIVSNLPELSHIATFRYATSSVLLCMCILAALFLDDAMGMKSTRLLLRLVPGFVLACTLFVIGFFSAPGGRAWAHHFLPKWYWGSILLLGATVVVLCLTAVLALTPWRRYVPIVLGAVLCIEAMGYFEVPILAYPRAVHYDTQVVAFLRSHLGTQRYFTVEPVGPNYGTYFGVASFDAADLPIPKNWSAYVHTHLNPYVLPWQFGNGGPQGKNGVSPLVAMLAHVTAFEASGVKFLVTPSTTHLNKYFQPRTGSGVATPNGGATIVLAWGPPTYFLTGVLTAITIPLPGGVPAGLRTSACSGGACVSASPTASSARGTTFTLDRPLMLGSTLAVTLVASNASPVHILSVPSEPDSPASVTADGVVLPLRAGVASFTYSPRTVPVLVSHTSAANVYLLPHPSPIATAPGCAVTAHSMTSFSITCAHPSTLTYRELSFAGWKASVNGSGVPIATVNKVFQSIPVPAGTATVAFTYSPPAALWAWLASLAGVVAIVVSLVRRRSARGVRRKGGAAADDADVRGDALPADATVPAAPGRPMPEIAMEPAGPGTGEDVSDPASPSGPGA